MYWTVIITYPPKLSFTHLCANLCCIYGALSLCVIRITNDYAIWRLPQNCIHLSVQHMNARTHTHTTIQLAHIQPPQPLYQPFLWPLTVAHTKRESVEWRTVLYMVPHYIFNSIWRYTGPLLPHTHTTPACLPDRSLPPVAFPMLPVRQHHLHQHQIIIIIILSITLSTTMTIKPPKLTLPSSPIPNIITTLSLLTLPLPLASTSTILINAKYYQCHPTSAFTLDINI